MLDRFLHDDYTEMCEEFLCMLRVLLACDVEYEGSRRTEVVKTRERQEGKITTAHIRYKGYIKTDSGKQCILKAVTQVIKPTGTQAPWIVDELTQVECVLDYELSVRRYCAGWQSIYEDEPRRIWIIERPATANTIGLYGTGLEENERDEVPAEAMPLLKQIK